MEAVPGCNYLYRRDAVYWFRRRVPTDVTAALGAAQWRVSLGTKDFDEAKRLARLRGVATDQEIAVARARNAGKVSPPLTKQEADRLGQGWLAETLEWDEVFRLGSAATANAELWLREDAPTYREALATYDTEAVAKETAQTLAKAGLWYPLGDSSRTLLSLSLLKARVQLVDLMERRLGGEVVEAAYPAPASRSAPSASGPTVRELLAAFRADRIARHGEESTERKYSHIFAALEETLGAERRVRAITRADVRDVRALLLRVPKFAGRRYPNLSLTDAADRADEEGGELMAPTTVNTYLQNLAAVFNWAVQEEFIDKSPAQGLALDASATVRRRGFTTEELEVIFRALAPMADGERPWRFWIPALALYSGARAGEIAGLRKTDLVMVEGVQCMRFTEFDVSGRRIEGRRLKNKVSERVVPIHTAVLEAGFMAYIADLPEDTELAFPTLPPGPAGKPAHYLSKWFGEFRQDVGVDAPSTPFHSFRHGFRDACRDAGIAAEIADMLGGWATQGVSTQYGDKGRVALLTKALEKVSFTPFSLPKAGL